MREMTLRSALSFGSCYLLRMLCDEYLSFRLEQVASSPLLAMPPPQPSRLNDNSNTNTREECPPLLATCCSPVNEDRAATTLLTSFNTEEQGVGGSRDADPPLWDGGQQSSSSFVSAHLCNAVFGNFIDYLKAIQVCPQLFAVLS